MRLSCVHAAEGTSLAHADGEQCPAVIERGAKGSHVDCPQRKGKVPFVMA